MNKWGIKIQALILALVPAIIIAVLLASYFLYSQIKLVNSTLYEYGENTAEHIADESQYGIFSGNLQSLKQDIEKYAREKSTRSITILNKDRTTLSQSGKEFTPEFLLEKLNSERRWFNYPKNNSIVFISSISPPLVDISEFYDTNKELPDIIGWVLVEVSLDNTDKQINSVLFNTLIITFFIGIIAILMAIRISKNVTQPVLSLSDVVKNIGDGDLGARAKVQSSGELHILESGINKMAEDLQALQKNLQSRVDMATTDLKDTLELLQSKNVELELARKDATEANKIKSEFLANMSHEIRTPINGIIGFTDLMLKSSNDTAQSSHLDMIKKSSLNLLSIVDDILDITRIEAGKLNITAEPLNLRECVEQVMTMMAPSVFNKGLDLSLLYYSDVPEEFYGDPLRINQIITNLIGNAIKFTENGSITIRVMIEEDDNDLSRITFSITDTGAGVPEDQREYLFKPFIQGDSSTTKKYGGSGLGLSICSSLVERMGGTIGLDTKINMGSTFWFTLPLTKNNNKSPLPIPESIENKRICLFDSNSISRLSIKHLLEKANVLVTEYGSTRHILSAVEDESLNEFDAIIISCKHSDIDLLTTELFRKIHGITGTKILVIAPTVDNEILSSVVKKGADTCISKPILRDRIYRALTGLLFDNVNSEKKPIKAETKNTTDKCNLNILIAEDNEINANLLSTIIKQHGSNFSIASNGEIVLELLSKQHFDIVLMDINMPVMDGVNAAKAIRDGCAIYPCEIPVIAVTANVLEKERQRFLDAGINDLVIKPITEKSVWETINKWVEHSCFMDEFFADDIKRLVPPDLYEKVKIEISDHTQKIITALEQNDMDTLFTHTHKLNGLAAYFNIPAIRDVVDKLETSIKQNKSRSELKSQIDHLHTEVEKMNS